MLKKQCLTQHQVNEIIEYMNPIEINVYDEETGCRNNALEIKDFDYDELPYIKDIITKTFNSNQIDIKNKRWHKQIKQSWANIHADVRENQDIQPAITVLFPLNSNGSTVVFDQRYIGNENISYDGSKKGDNPQIKYKHNGFNLSDEEYKFLKHFKKSQLKGLTIRRIYEWYAGDMIVFDSRLLHTAGFLENPPKECIAIKFTVIE